MLLNLFPDNKQKIEAIKTVGSAVLLYAAVYPELLRLLLNILPYDGNKLEIIETVAAREGTLLHRVVDNPELLSMFLNLCSDDGQKLEIIKELDKHSTNVLYCAVGIPESLRLLLNLYPDDEQKLKAVEKYTIGSCSVLHRAVGTPESLRLLLNLYPDDEQKLKALNMYGWKGSLTANEKYFMQGSTVLDLAVNEESPESLRTILSLISDESLRINIIERFCRVEILWGRPYFDISDTTKKLIPIYSPILEMERFILSFIRKEKGLTIDADINDFFSKLKMLAIKYEVDGVKSEEKTKQFQIDFATLLHSQDEFMATHRQLWKPILINLLIACTGIGLLAIIGHAISNALIKINKNEQIYASDLLFFAKTKRQQRLEILEEQISDKHILPAY